MIANNLYERYQRQIILKGVGETGQQKLMEAKVLVIGAGGLGCPALQYLAAAGVGTIGIVDEDLISLSNLHRQVLYSSDDIGLLKVDVATLKLHRLNPEIKIITHALRLQNTNALNILSEYDYVIDGTDNFASRYMINDACVLLNKPLIHAAVSQYEGQIAVFNVKDDKGKSINYRDLFPNPPADDEVLSCAEAGVLGVVPGIIGTMQAAEAIKLITNISKPLINKLLTYNTLTHEIYEVNLSESGTGKELIPKDEASFLAMNYYNFCNVQQSSVIEIDAEQFHHLRKKTSAIVIDVREKDELPLVTNIRHLQIPMSVFEEKISDIQQQTIILFCQHGVRSLHAAEILHDKYGISKEVYSLKGGVVKWLHELGISK